MFVTQHFSHNARLQSICTTPPHSYGRWAGLIYRPNDTSLRPPSWPIMTGRCDGRCIIGIEGVKTRCKQKTDKTIIPVPLIVTALYHSKFFELFIFLPLGWLKKCRAGDKEWPPPERHGHCFSFRVVVVVRLLLCEYFSSDTFNPNGLDILLSF